MKKCSSCRGIGITLSLAILCLVLSVVIGLTARDRKCGTFRGLECHENHSKCDEDLPCYCAETKPVTLFEWDTEEYCKNRDWEVTGAARVFAGLFSLLFFVFVIASIVQCIVAACCRDTNPTPTIAMVPAKPVN